MKKQYKTTLHAFSIREGFSIRDKQQKPGLRCHSGGNLFYLEIPKRLTLYGDCQEEDIALKHKEQKGHLNLLHITGTDLQELNTFVNKIIRFISKNIILNGKTARIYLL